VADGSRGSHRQHPGGWWRRGACWAAPRQMQVGASPAVEPCSSRTGRSAVKAAAAEPSSVAVVGGAPSTRSVLTRGCQCATPCARTGRAASPSKSCRGLPRLQGGELVKHLRQGGVEPVKILRQVNGGRHLGLELGLLALRRQIDSAKNLGKNLGWRLWIPIVTNTDIWRREMRGIG